MDNGQIISLKKVSPESPQVFPRENEALPDMEKKFEDFLLNGDLPISEKLKEKRKKIGEFKFRKKDAKDLILKLEGDSTIPGETYYGFL